VQTTLYIVHVHTEFDLHSHSMWRVVCRFGDLGRCEAQKTFQAVELVSEDGLGKNVAELIDCRNVVHSNVTIVSGFTDRSCGI